MPETPEPEDVRSNTKSTEVSTPRIAADAHAPGGDDLVGIGTAPGHHGELLQGVFETDDAEDLVPAVLSMPFPFGNSTAVFKASNAPEVAVQPDWKHKARRAAEKTLEELGHAGEGGTLELTSDLTVGRGLGSSTADVTAAVRAVAAAFGVELDDERVAAVAVSAESASDSVMFDRPHLFANQEGTVIDWAAKRLPPLHVIGFDALPKSNGVLTDRRPRPSYTPFEQGVFQVLRASVRRAIAARDPHLLGRVATESARISQRYFPLPLISELLDALPTLPAIGVQVAHSGTIVGVLLAADGSDNFAEQQTIVSWLTDRGVAETWEFSLG